MNIGFDAQAILSVGSKNRGIGNYSTSLFSKMIDLDKANHYYCMNVFEEKITNNYIKESTNFHEIYYYSGDNLEYIQKEYEGYYGLIVSSFIKNNNIDIFYITSPFNEGFLTYKKEWFLGAKIMTILYDVIPWIFKEHYLRNKDIQSWYLNRIEMIKFSDKVLAISHSAKNDFVKIFDCDSNKVEVINGAPDERFCVVNIEEDRAKTLLNKHGIYKKYLICTGGNDMRKNLDGLIISFAKVDESIRKDYQLVIVCKIDSNSKEYYMNIAKNNGVFNDVVFTGFVDDNEIVELNNLAYAMVFVSKYEGFGLPVVEAYSCQVPVVTSNNSSLHEVGENAAILVDPFNTDDIARGITEVLTTTNVDEMIKNGTKKLKEYNWRKVAQNCIAINNALTLNDDGNIKKLAVFTPLPPMESGISDFSYDVICELSKHIDKIDVYIDDYEANVSFPKNVRVINHKKFIPIYDQVLYEVGNSDFHTYMFKYLETFKGIVELHDSDTKGLFSYLSMYKNGMDYDAFSKYFIDDLGKDVINNIVRNQISPERIKYDKSINGYITHNANELILHSMYAINSVINNYIGVKANYIPHYVKIKKQKSKEEAKVKLGIPLDQVFIGSFGIVANTKRYTQIIKACKLLKNNGMNFILIFVGKCLDDNVKDCFNTLINNYNLQDNIKITGFVSLDEFEDYMDAVDITLNLRHPYNGETSGALVRSLSKGKCIIANNVGYFGEIPDDVCYKLPKVETFESEDEEIMCIANSLLNLMSDTQKIREFEKNARKYAEDNLDIKKLISKYVQILNKMYNINYSFLEEFIKLVKNDVYNNEDKITKIAKSIMEICGYTE